LPAGEILPTYQNYATIQKTTEINTQTKKWTTLYPSSPHPRFLSTQVIRNETRRTGALPAFPARILAWCARLWTWWDTVTLVAYEALALPVAFLVPGDRQLPAFLAAS